MVRQHLEEQKAEESENLETVDVIEENQNILTGKYYDYFKNVFEKHQEKAKKYYEVLEEEKVEEIEEKGSDEEGEKVAPGKTEEKMSRSQKKKMRWLKVADLKARAKRPDLVEAWDITAPDPLFLC